MEIHWGTISWISYQCGGRSTGVCVVIHSFYLGEIIHKGGTEGCGMDLPLKGVTVLVNLGHNLGIYFHQRVGRSKELGHDICLCPDLFLPLRYFGDGP